MSNQEYRVFHSRGYLSLLVIPNTRIFHFLFLLCNRETHFGCCPILPSSPSNTKHIVDLYHALIPMSCDVTCINAMQCHCMYLMLPRATIQNHTSIQSTCDSFFMHYKHTSHQASIIYAKITWYPLLIMA